MTVSVGYNTGNHMWYAECDSCFSQPTYYTTEAKARAAGQKHARQHAKQQYDSGKATAGPEGKIITRFEW
jgi:hypothetical protein